METSSADPLAASPPSRAGSTPWLDQPNERANDAVKQSAELRRERLHPAERFRRFEARQRLPRRSRSGLIAGLPVLAARVGTLGQIQRDADQRPLELITECRAACAQHRKIR